jgi:single-strand DNA-binding protein
MSNLNRIVLVGLVSQKPETRFGVENSTSLSKFVLQVERPARQDGTVDYDHIPVVAFGKSADYVAERVQQNTLVIVEGRIQVRSTDTNGQRTWLTEVMASSVKTLGGSNSAPVAQAPVTAENPFEAASFTEDDVPF